MTKALNPPPHWPEPPRAGWAPPEGWRPDRSWGAVPAGWRLWDDGSEPRTGPLAESEEISASGARPRQRPERYPVAVTQPGQWSSEELAEEDHGFPPAASRPDRPRRRRVLRIVAAGVGILVALATAVLFTRLVRFAHEDLPASSLGAPAAPLLGPAVIDVVGQPVS